MNIQQHRTGYLQYAIVILFMILTFVNPHDRLTWFLELFWIPLGIVVLLPLHRKNIYPTSILSWAMVAHACVLIYGAWYTYELVPLGEWLSAQCAWERNYYDRFGHFIQGFVPAILVREVLVRNKVVNGPRWLETMVFICVMAFTGIFEIIEFAAAMILADGAAAYLGSQGDIWDAQWDMVYCGIGGLLSILLVRSPHRKALNKLMD